MTQHMAVVSGGMGGLGEAICIKLARMGYKVVTTCSPGNTKREAWLAEHGGANLPARNEPGNIQYRGIEPAPGRYVKQRSD